MAAIREAEMFCVPLLHLLLIRGLEEDTTDAEDSALAGSWLFSFSVIVQGQCRFGSNPAALSSLFR
jgi:hypothetical protein